MSRPVPPSKSSLLEQYRAAVDLFRANRLDQAEQAFQQILARQPNFSDAFQMLGVIASKRGQHDKGVELLSQAIALLPNQAGYHYNLAKVYEAIENDADAEAAYREAIRLAPNNPSAWLNLAGVMLRRPDREAAIKVAGEAVRMLPNSVPALNNLGLALARVDERMDEAERLFRHALELDPVRADTYVNLAHLYVAQERYEEATGLLTRAVELAPGMAEAYNNLSSTLKFEGRLKEALAYSRKALELAPAANPHSNLLFILNYSPDIEPEALLKEHVAWAELYANPFFDQAPPFNNSPDPDRRLRIGYISPDFRKHPVATFMQPVMATHDRDRFEIFCYANLIKFDDITDWFKSHTDHWRDIAFVSDDEVAGQIRADQIDILVDLAGHTSGNRLLVMARRPAPVQASYLGYLGTTGMRAIDYKLTDAATDPAGETKAFHTEKMMRMSAGMWCYSPPESAPEVAPPPVLTKGYITFGSFNNSAKISDAVIALWSRVLLEVPNSRLRMFTKGEGRIHDHLRERFSHFGVAPDRLDLSGRIPFVDFLAQHADVDIALDPFPYTGGTTTCHSLWMGVPVITLPGSRAFSRSSASLLTTIGLTDWIADSPDDYVRIAREKSAAPLDLNCLRAELRGRMQASPLTQADIFTRSLETAYRAMWSNWCHAQAK